MKPKRGRPEERLKIDLPLSQAIRDGLSKQRPHEGWPKPEKPAKEAQSPQK